MQNLVLAPRRKSVSVLLVQHAGRSGNARGTSRHEDVLDTVISLKRPDDYGGAPVQRVTRKRDTGPRHLDWRVVSHGAVPRVGIVTASSPHADHPTTPTPPCRHAGAARRALAFWRALLVRTDDAASPGSPARPLRQKRRRRA